MPQLLYFEFPIVTSSETSVKSENLRKREKHFLKATIIFHDNEFQWWRIYILPTRRSNLNQNIDDIKLYLEYLGWNKKVLFECDKSKI